MQHLLGIIQDHFFLIGHSLTLLISIVIIILNRMKTFFFIRNVRWVQEIVVL